MPADKSARARRIDWTGERCVPWTDDIQVIYEHFQRYLFVAQIAGGRRVLDLASGEGYGSAILASTAENVLGIELDANAVLHASETYERANLAFRQGDMLDLSDVEDESFDLVVCFEALEHVEEHDRLLDGVTRVLATGGTFVVSTPDRLKYNEGHDEANPFHVHELSLGEFRALLDKRFAHVRVWGQNVAVGSVMLPVAGESSDSVAGGLTTIQRRDDSWSAGPPLAPTYFIAAASNGELPELPAFSTMVDPDIELVRAQMRHAATAQSADEDLLGQLQQVQYELQRATVREDVLRDRVRATRGETRRLAEELERAGTWAAGLEQERSDALAELERTRTSSAFRLASSLQHTAEQIAPVSSERRERLTMLARRARALLERSRSTPPLPALTEGDRPAAGEDAPPPGGLPFLPTSSTPLASIVIPVHGGWSTTARCLWSLAEDIPATSYEVIVVDDASQDETPRMLAHVGGVRVVTLDENRGFVHAVNAGAAVAKAPFIVLLNNDTEVQAGWLDALVATATSSGDIGVVGSRLVYPDGVLQEAGGIIFGDGSGWNYGRGNEPGYCAFTFRRDVDYCSGACLLVRRDLWEAIGGFDTRFAPAYYEDVDLAFAARGRGYRVVYEPRAVVLHEEGSSYGNDDSPRKNQLMAANRGTLLEKWRSEIATRAKNDGTNVRASSWRRPKGHALVVDHMTPTFDQDAGSQRMYELLRMLSDLGYAVTFIPYNTGNIPRYTEALEELGIEVLHGTLDIAHTIAELAPDLRLAILSRPKVAWGIVPMLQELAPAARIVYDTVDLHFVRERRRAELEGGEETARIAEHYRDMELWLTRNCDATFVVSESERALLLAEVPDARTHVIPTIHRRQHPGPDHGGRSGLLFVGGYNHPPNLDAVEWLVEEILPIVRIKLPDVPTYVVGSNPPQKVLDLAGNGVEVLGWVQDLRPLYSRSRIFVAPLRYGAGIRGKIGESASFGLPVVSTTLGAEGLELVAGRDILVADKAADFADAVVRAYSDAALWSDLSLNARRAIAAQCAPDAVRRHLASILDELVDIRS